MSSANTIQEPDLNKVIVPPAKEKPAATKSVAKANPVIAVKAATKPATKVGVKTAIKPAAKTPAIKSKPVAKSAQPAKAVAKTAAVVPVEKEKAKKIKLVRDSFTMPEIEYAVLGQIKKNCLSAGVDVKKSELLRIGVALIREMDVDGLKKILATLPQLKSGRPTKGK